MTMEDKDIEAGLPQEPPPTYQVPDWEGTVKPPLTRKQSILNMVADRTQSIKAATAPHFARTYTHRNGQDRRSSRSSTNSTTGSLDGKVGGEKGAAAKAFEAGLSFSNRHTHSIRAGTSRAMAPGGVVGRAKTTCVKTFDRVIPPYKTYLGRSRRVFLLAVVLPLATIFLFILPLALGIGLGRNHQNLPFPSNKQVFTGDLTYYSPALGACGWTNDADDAVVAVSRLLWDAKQEGTNPNTNPLCGKKIRVQRDFVEEGKGVVSVDLTVVDRCVGCEATDVDLAIGMFSRLAMEEHGRVIGSWAWLD